MDNTFTGASVVTELVFSNHGNTVTLGKQSLTAREVFCHHTFEKTLQTPIQSQDGTTKYIIDEGVSLYELYTDVMPNRVKITLESPSSSILTLTDLELVNPYYHNGMEIGIDPDPSVEYVVEELILCEYDKSYIEIYNKQRDSDLFDNKSYFYLPHPIKLNTQFIKKCNQRICVYIYGSPDHILFAEYKIPLDKMETLLFDREISRVTNACYPYYRYNKIITSTIKYSKHFFSISEIFNVSQIPIYMIIINDTESSSLKSPLNFRLITNNPKINTLMTSNGQLITGHTSYKTSNIAVRPNPYLLEHEYVDYVCNYESHIVDGKYVIGNLHMNMPSQVYPFHGYMMLDDDAQLFVDGNEIFDGRVLSITVVMCDYLCASRHGIWSLSDIVFTEVPMPQPISPPSPQQYVNPTFDFNIGDDGNVPVPSYQLDQEDVITYKEPSFFRKFINLFKRIRSAKEPCIITFNPICGYYVKCDICDKNISYDAI